MATRKKRTELAATNLRWTGVLPDFTKGDNQRAWDAIYPFLADTKYAETGHSYELLSRKARNAASSVGPGFINYCEELGYLQIAQDDKRELLRPGEAALVANIDPD